MGKWDESLELTAQLSKWGEKLRAAQIEALVVKRRPNPSFRVHPTWSSVGSRHLPLPDHLRVGMTMMMSFGENSKSS
jgi:hypothetical protein